MVAKCVKAQMSPAQVYPSRKAKTHCMWGCEIQSMKFDKIKAAVLGVCVSVNCYNMCLCGSEGALSSSREMDATKLNDLPGFREVPEDRAEWQAGQQKQQQQPTFHCLFFVPVI